MDGISRVAFVFKLNWEVISALILIVAGIVAYMLLKDSKFDRKLFKLWKWDMTLAKLCIPAGIVLGIALGLILWAAGVNRTFWEIEIYWYAVVIVLGMLAAIVAAIFLAKKKGYEADLIIDIALVAIPLGILGARIWFVIFPYSGGGPQIDSFLDFFNLRAGGLGIYGGVIGGALGVVIVAVWKKINILRLLDIAAPVVMLAQCIGRWGNFFNQEAHGFEILNPALQWFPFGILKGGRWYLATFFYESMWNLVGFIALYWFCYNRNRIDGLGTCGYFLWYGIGRAWIESLRTDQLFIGSVPVSILFSVIMIVVALAGGAYLIWNYRKKQRTVPSDPEEKPEDENK